MNCPKCNNIVEPTWNICPFCGAELNKSAVVSEPEPEISKTLQLTPFDAKKWAVGNKVLFGRFVQSMSRVKAPSAIDKVAETKTLEAHPRKKEYELDPIEWSILESDEEKCLLVATKILYALKFNQKYKKETGKKSNNYAESEVREWLNREFLNTAFTDEEQAAIFIANVDNSCASTGDMKNKNACADTADKVFLLSNAEVNTYFKSTNSRWLPVTPYAKRSGAYVKENVNIGWWWLRSPAGSSVTKVQRVSSDGEIRIDDSCCSVSDRGGIVPAIYVRPGLVL